MKKFRLEICFLVAITTVLFVCLVFYKELDLYEIFQRMAPFIAGYIVTKGIQLWRASQAKGK